MERHLKNSRKAKEFSKFFALVSLHSVPLAAPFFKYFLIII